jgi:hypothetical protein
MAKRSKETRERMSLAQKKSWEKRRSEGYVAKNMKRRVESNGDVVPAKSIVEAVRSARTLVNLVGKTVARELIDV